jgi:hypothetical protein
MIESKRSFKKLQPDDVWIPLWFWHRFFTHSDLGLGKNFCLTGQISLILLWIIILHNLLKLLNKIYELHRLDLPGDALIFRMFTVLALGAVSSPFTVDSYFPIIWLLSLLGLRWIISAVLPVLLPDKDLAGVADWIVFIFPDNYLIGALRTFGGILIACCCSLLKFIESRVSKFLSSSLNYTKLTA